MAGNYKINVKDRQAANAWIEAVRAIDQDYYDAMNDASEALMDVKSVANGTLVDELTNVGDAMLNAAKTVFDEIDKIADTINSFFDAIDNFVEEAGGIIGKAASFINKLT